MKGECGELTNEFKTEFGFICESMGNRLEKTVNNDAGAWSNTEYYVRDAQGNVMAIYKK
jgi:hypothetical protein